MWTATARLLMRNELSELARVSAWLRGWAKRHDVPLQTVERLDLCSTEVLTNILSYGYPEGGTRHISVSLGLKGQHVALEVQDDGRPFDPLSAATPRVERTLEGADIGGWGIAIVRHFSDELHYQHREGCNLLMLTFRLSAAAPIDDSSAQVSE